MAVDPRMYLAWNSHVGKRLTGLYIRIPSAYSTGLEERVMLLMLSMKIRRRG